MAQAIRLTKLKYETLQQVATPWTRYKPKVSKLGIESISAESLVQKAMFAKFGLEVLYSNELWTPPEDSSQAVRSTKITYNVLFKVMNPYVPLKSKISKIAYEAVTFQRIVQKARFAKFGIEVLYSNNSWDRPSVVQQGIRNTKITYNVLFTVPTPYIPLKSKISKLSYEAVLLERINQIPKFAKFGMEVLYPHLNSQACKTAKISMEALTCIEPYKVIQYPIGDWYDSNWPHRQMITIDRSAVEFDMYNEWIGILYDETGEEIFGRNYAFHVVENFDTTNLLTKYQVNQAILGSVYTQDGTLFISAKAHQHAHLHADTITNRNVEAQIKIKVNDANSGHDLAPGLGFWWDANNVISQKNTFATNNRRVGFRKDGDYTVVHDTTVNGTTDWRWYKIKLDADWIYFMDSTDGTSWVTFQRFEREGIMSRIPEEVLVGKGIYKPPTYKNYDWDNDYVSLGNQGMSYMDDLTIMSWGDGKDIVVTRDDKLTKIDHEVSYFDPANGCLVFVCRAPVLKQNQDNNFFVYYGNSKITRDQGNPYNAWSTDHGNDLVLRAVPAKDGTSVQVFNYADSNHGVVRPTIDVTKIMRGLIGRAIQFDGVGDWIEFQHRNPLNYRTFLVKCMEAVFKMDSTQGGTIISKMGDSGYQLKVDKTTGRFSFIVKHDASNIHESYHESTEFEYRDNTFHTIELLANRNQEKARFWFDDTEVAVSYTGPALNNVALKAMNLDSTVNLYVGCDNNQENLYHGALGHTRISRNSRLWGWMKLIRQKHRWVKKWNTETFRISRSDLVLDILFRVNPARPSSQPFIFTSMVWKIIYWA